ncbi:MAG: hypothetical protein DRI81_12075, partial [Chloroflexi bacterium]
MKHCPQCNTQLPDDARFCLNCGAPQEGVSQTTVSGDGAIAQGPGAVAAGAGGAAVGGDVHGDVIIGELPQDPADLRTAYLNHLFETAGALSLSGIDPKAASEAEARLNLGAVYTSLLTLTSEECERLQARERL